jgi:outer membrane protein, multidrug efflux system
MRRLAALAAAALLLAVAGSPVHAQSRDADEAVRFWSVLGDTALERLVETAMAANRDVATARARIAAARAARSRSAFDLAPSAGAVAGYSRQRASVATLPGSAGGTVLPDQDIWDAGLQLSWDLDVFGSGRRTLSGRGALVSAAEEDARDVELTIAAEVARTWLQLQGLTARLDVARQNAANQERTLELTVDRLDAGRGNALDTERARAQLRSTRAEIPSLEAGIDALRQQLAVLVGGTAVLDGVVATGTQPDMPARLVSVATAELARQRPDVRSAGSRAAAQHAFLGAARSAYLPRVSIGGVAGYTASALDALGERGTPRYAFGPVISWPLLDLGRIRSNVDAARAEHAAAIAQHEQAELAARAEIESTLTSYARARERLAHLEDAAAASARATDLARLRFREGASDFLEVLDAERRQLEAQDRLAAGRTAAADWLVAVYRATGGAVQAER